MSGSLALGVGQLPVAHTLGGGDQCGEQRGPDLKHSTTTMYNWSSGS